MVSHEALLDAIETCNAQADDVPGVATPLSLPGLRGQRTPLSHPFANYVGTSSLSAESADAAIGAVKAEFEAERKAVGWMVGPRSTPADLARRLETHGFVKAVEMSGMARTDMAMDVRTNPEIEVREASDDATRRFSDVTAEAYGMPLELARHLNEKLIHYRERLGVRIYHAYPRGEARPVGFATHFMLPGTPIVLLGGAGTLAAWRGRGIYTSFVVRRMAAARRDGARAAIIVAVRATSAPICAKLGFEELAAVDLYAWTPEPAALA